MRKRFSQWMLQWRYPAVPVAIGVLLALPSLWGGLQFDDYGIRATVLDLYVVEGISADPLQPFSFLDGDPIRNQRLMDYGFLPWWSDLECRAAFMRPLTALTHMVDYRLLDDYPVLMHAQSLIWFALLIWAAAILYRRLMSRTMPPWFAALAALLFAVDEAHAGPVGWLANRNAVLAGLFGVLTLIAYDRWRRDGWRPAAALAPAALLAGLLSKESAVCTGAYLLAYAIFLDGGPWIRRLIGLTPCILVGLAWYVAYRALGFGTAHSGVYVDPAHDPLGFAFHVARDAPILLLGQWGLPPSQFSLWCSAPALRLYWLGAMVFLLLWAVFFVPLVARSPLTRFWTMGMMLSLLPACAAFPDDRLLMFVGLGAMGLLAQFLGGLKEGAPWQPSSAAWKRLARVGGFAFVAIHLIIAPLFFPMTLVSLKSLGRRVEALVNTLPSDDPQFERQTLILVNSPAWLYDMAVLHIRHYREQPLPARMLNLTSSFKAAKLARPDANTLLVRPVGGYLPPPGGPGGSDSPLPDFSIGRFAHYLDRLFRDDRRPLALGDTVELPIVTITITDVTEDGRAAEATFRFRAALEDASLRWFTLTKGGHVEFQPPVIGQTVEVPLPLSRSMPRRLEKPRSSVAP